MIATSSPGLMILSSASSTSTYSRLTVKALLSNTLALIPGYLVSSSSNNRRGQLGPGRNSDAFLVYVAAEAKYRRLK